ncbi:acetate--CoA ligase family protein [Thauera sp.]|mgnify:CR=1 FL=1|jgi:cyanophycin synthetase|uniref:acetate--CoA ligase family protein n=1 Tax=Thauera sp. TaxID=1905334 RepID=UPI002BA325CC|nr:acetate--CoA ligase family protein [Thauera sp.]HRO35532.1 acetate--CoA ligase family protein [Thauera sp.]
MVELVRVGAPFTWLRGAAFGLQQGALLGELALAGEGRAGIVEEMLEAFADEAPFAEAEAGAGEASGVERLLDCILRCVGALQRRAGIPVSWRNHRGLIRNVGNVRFFRVALPSEQPVATERALRWVLAEVNRRASDECSGSMHEPSRRESLEELERVLGAHAIPGINPINIALAAFRAEIPVGRLLQDVLVLGQGRRARWMRSTITDRTPGIGIGIAGNKVNTALVLRAAGLPVPEQVIVRSAEGAVDAARAIRYPVVVKPADQEQGEGVQAGLCEDAMVRAAYRAASALSRTILVERHVGGFTHRLTVFQGRVLRVMRRVAGGVVGDGVSDVATLVERRLEDEIHRRRAQRAGAPLLSLDTEALDLLARRGMAPASVPAAGEYIRLRRRDNINAGGENQPCALGDVHPANLQLAVDAAMALRLDLAGVDLIIEDISRSWLEAGGAICEVNAQPQMGANSHAGVFDAVVRELVDGDGRIPVHLVVCPDREDWHAGLSARLLQHGEVDGVSSRHGLFLPAGRVSRPFEDALGAAQALLLRTDVGCAACLMSAPDILRLGLPSDVLATIRIADETAMSAAERGALEALRPLVEPHLRR